MSLSCGVTRDQPIKRLDGHMTRLVEESWNQPGTHGNDFQKKDVFHVCMRTCFE